MKNGPNSQLGYTLIELIITVTIIAVIAAIAVPAFSSAPDKRLQLAAEEFAAAMRFARTEAMRTGKPHGFRQEVSEKRIRVFRLDEATNPPTLVYDVYHPANKQLYEIPLAAEAASLNRTPTFRGACNKTANVYFDANGMGWCTDPSTVLLDTFEVQLELGTNQIAVTVDGITGRVTVR